jgi:hypothetical protein
MELEQRVQTQGNEFWFEKFSSLLKRLLEEENTQHVQSRWMSALLA